MARPNFIVAGEAKAGTTAMYVYLSQHPDVFMSESKEPRYFAFRGKRPDFRGPMDEEWFNQTTVYEKDAYYELFKHSSDKKAVGEASPIYMHVPGCAQAIAEELPDVKIIVLLRHPIELAFSAYQHMSRGGHETLSFEDALQEEPRRIENNWAWHWRYSSLGFVAGNIASFLECFPRKNILFLKYDDFQADNLSTLKRVAAFLGLSDEFEFKPTQANVNAKVRWGWMNGWINNLFMKENHWLKRLCRLFIPRKTLRSIGGKVRNLIMRPMSKEISNATYQKLLNVYADDIRLTQELTGLKLDSWLVQKNKPEG